MTNSRRVGRNGGQLCLACCAPNRKTKFTRAQIEKLLATNPNKSEIARITGLCDDTLHRHFKVCVPALAAKLEEHQVMGLESLVEDIGLSRQEYRDTIQATGDQRDRLMAARALDAQVKMRGVFSGHYVEKRDTNVTLTVEGVEALLQRIGAVLGKHPDAIKDVSPLIAEFENQVLQLGSDEYTGASETIREEYADGVLD